MTDRSDDDVLARLRALDEAFERRGVPSEARERMGGALQERALERRFAAKLRWWPVLAFAAGAAVMAAALLFGGERSRSSDAPVVVDETKPTPIDSGAGAVELVVDEPIRSCADAKPGVGELAAGACVVGDGVRISGLIGSRYEWADDRVVLVAGELLLDVESRPESPLTVMVGEAAIEVIGTSFVVHRDAELGWISLLEGHVRVRVGEQPAVDLREGGQLEWSAEEQAAEPAPVREPAASARRDEDEGLAELLEEVAGLRRQGEYQAAIDRLRAGDREGWSARGRQLVSYEIGSLLERQLRDFEAACEHWAEHRKRYPRGRYESIIERSVARMDCADD